MSLPGQSPNPGSPGDPRQNPDSGPYSDTRRPRPGHSRPPPYVEENEHNGGRDDGDDDGARDHAQSSSQGRAFPGANSSGAENVGSRRSRISQSQSQSHQSDSAREGARTSRRRTSKPPSTRQSIHADSYHGYNFPEQPREEMVSYYGGGPMPRPPLPRTPPPRTPYTTPQGSINPNGSMYGSAYSPYFYPPPPHAPPMTPGPMPFGPHPPPLIPGAMLGPQMPGNPFFAAPFSGQHVPETYDPVFESESQVDPRSTYRRGSVHPAPRTEPRAQSRARSRVRVSVEQQPAINDPRRIKHQTRKKSRGREVHFESSPPPSVLKHVPEPPRRGDYEWEANQTKRRLQKDREIEQARERGRKDFERDDDSGLFHVSDVEGSAVRGEASIPSCPDTPGLQTPRPETPGLRTPRPRTPASVRSAPRGYDPRELVTRDELNLLLRSIMLDPDNPLPPHTARESDLSLEERITALERKRSGRAMSHYSSSSYAPSDIENRMLRWESNFYRDLLHLPNRGGGGWGAHPLEYQPRQMIEPPYPPQQTSGYVQQQRPHRRSSRRGRSRKPPPAPRSEPVYNHDPWGSYPEEGDSSLGYDDELEEDEDPGHYDQPVQTASRAPARDRRARRGPSDAGTTASTPVRTPNRSTLSRNRSHQTSIAGTGSQFEVAATGGNGGGSASRSTTSSSWQGEDAGTPLSESGTLPTSMDSFVGSPGARRRAPGRSSDNPFTGTNESARAGNRERRGSHTNIALPRLNTRMAGQRPRHDADGGIYHGDNEEDDDYDEQPSARDRSRRLYQIRGSDLNGNRQPWTGFNLP